MPNDDYIKRSDALDAFCGACEGTEVCGQLGELCEEVKRIMAIPAADVEPKRAVGVWLEEDETPNVSSNKIYRCSVCGYADEQSPRAEVPYCWHCGSRMKKMFPKSKEAENAFPSN